MVLAADFRKRAPSHALLYAQIQALNPPGAAEAIEPGLAKLRVESDDLQGYTVPTLVLAGREDAFFSPAAMREVANLIPGARFQEIPRAGHSAYFETPEEYNAIVAAFLREHE